MIEYLITVNWGDLAPLLMVYPLFSIGVVFMILRISDIRRDQAVARAMEARRRSLEHGARGWDCPKPGPIHYIPEEIPDGKGGARVPFVQLVGRGQRPGKEGGSRVR